MRITMIGAGYVGLTSGTCLALLGHDVCCYDIDAKRIARLKRCDPPLYEPGLRNAMGVTEAAGRLRFSSKIGASVANADVVFIAVGTPSGPNGIDLSQVVLAAEQIAQHLKRSALVVIKSTVVVGTARRVREIIARERGAFDIRVASNPEFLREGSAMADFMQPDRIVIGADDTRSRNILRAVFRPLWQRGVPVVATTTGNAEMIKYASNAFLALKIGFVNDLSDLCEKTGGNISDVAYGVGLDRRIGESFLAPGPGFGGSCFPKDARAFATTARQFGAPQRLVETLISRNDQRKVMLTRRILEAGRFSRGDTVAILGLAFKANTDDVRESAALTIIPLLQEEGLQVVAHDPKATKNASQHVKDVKWSKCPYAACDGAAAAVILTEWDEYRRLDLARIAGLLTGQLLIDYRNLFDPRNVSQHGLRYISLGRGGGPANTGHHSGIPSLKSWDQQVAASGHG